MTIYQNWFILALASVLAPVRAAENVLVIVDSPARLDTHTLFLNKLKSGFNTEIKHVEDPTLILKKYGQFLYDHVVLLAPSTEEFSGGKVSTDTLVEFIDAGGNVLVTADVETGDAIRELASEVGVEIDESGNTVIDHFNFDTQDEGYHTRIKVSPDNLIKSEHIVKPPSAECLYHGTGLATDSANPLVLNILTGSSTSYSHNPQEMIKDYPHVVGKNTILIAGLQARNNARVIILGSIDFLSDSYLTAKVGKDGKVAGNSDVVSDIVAWCFKQAGVIKIDFVEHKSVETGNKSPSFYTVKEECEFSVKISELVQGAWVPYQANDVQFEFVRIDPFVRSTMVADKGGVFRTKFMIPDVYGVFKFVVKYSRPGLTSISSSNQISVHPLRHNQYERFIYSAYPYYASAFSMMFGVFVFSFVFLHHKEPEAKPKSE